MPYHFFPMIARMRYINRWGLMRNTRSENICEHSLEVARKALEQGFKAIREWHCSFQEHSSYYCS